MKSGLRIGHHQTRGCSLMDFDDPELLEVETVLTSDRLNIDRDASTPETKARWAKLKSRKEDTTWQEGRFLYRQGKCGVTVSNPERWS